MDTTTILTLILAFPFLLLILSVFDPSKNSSVASPFLRWLQRKRYQYEVTFSLYMLTPTEKFVLSTSHSLFLSLPCSCSSTRATSPPPHSLLFPLLFIHLNHPDSLPYRPPN